MEIDEVVLTAVMSILSIVIVIVLLINIYLDFLEKTVISCQYMMIYTSYYGLANSLKKYKIKMICISSIKPSWLPWIDEIKVLAPPLYLIHETSILEMRKRYLEHLEKVGVDEIRYELAMRGNKDIALLCYETYSDIKKGVKFCHRRFFFIVV